MSAPSTQRKIDADYRELVMEPALAVIRSRLLQDHPTDVIDYISLHGPQIRFEIEAVAILVGASTSLAATPAATMPSQSTETDCVTCPAFFSTSVALPTAALPAHPTPLSPRPTASARSSTPPSTAGGAGGKFDTFVMPSGEMEDFHKGLPSRIGFPHLEFEKTMEAEHTSMAGCDMRFTTHNYGITSTAKAEWGVVVRGQAPPPEHMLHGRVAVPVEDKLRWMNEQFAKKGLEVRLRREEVIAVILYTGPMHMIYNCVLARWSNPAAMWDTLCSGNNLFTTTLSVLVSAVQKLSMITVITDGLKLYRGTGGLSSLPQHFSKPDEFNCRGMTEWGFMSCSADKEVAMGYSGAAEGRPHAMVLEIEPSVVDRGAVVSEMSQYPKKVETLFLPMSYVFQNGQRRVERSAKGEVTVIPVRVSVNLKVERLEQMEEKKKSIHLMGFEFRVNQVRQRLQRLAEEGGAETRLKKDKDRQGLNWKKAHSVEGFVEAQVKKVQAVLLRHRERPAADYSDDVIYRKLVSESLETARMAELALMWWLRDEGQDIHKIEDGPLLDYQRRFESFLRLKCRRKEESVHCTAVVELCRIRNLLLIDASERDENGETPLIALSTRGGSVDDVHLLVTAGSDLGAVTREGHSAMFRAALQGHAEVVEALVRSGADCNQTTVIGQTPLFAGSLSGHLRCVELLLKGSAAVNVATRNGSTPLYIASSKGHCDVVDALVRGGADVKTAGNDGATPLFMASQNGHCEVVDSLIGWSADVNKAGNDDMTPLYTASFQGHCDVIVALLRGGADANKAASNSVTPLNIASFQGHCNVVDALLRGGADVNKATNDVVTPIFIASQRGHCGVVAALLRGGADINKAKNDGSTPLFTASSNGHCDVVDALLCGGADINKANNDSTTPLFVASRNGHCNVVDVLLRGGADLNKANNNGATPLFIASQNRHCDVVHALLRRGADVNKGHNNGSTPLFLASSNGHCDVVHALVRGGADMNKSWKLEMTPLFVASQKGHCDVVDALVRGGADVNKEAKDGITPLFISSLHGHCDVVDVLLRGGADLNKAMNDGANNGATPLCVASKMGHCDVVDALVRGGADVNKEAKDGITPLFISSFLGHCNVVDVLLRGGADLNKANYNGATPLFIASQNRHCDVVHALLRRGADVNKAMNDGATPLHISSFHGHCDVVDALLRGGADMNKSWKFGMTPLFVASQKGHCDVVDALVRGGADVNKAMNDGATPLFISSKEGHCDVVDVLLRGGADVNKAADDGGTPVLISSQKGHAVVLSALLAAGGDVSKTLTSGPNKGASALWAAAFSGRVECLQQLLSAGCAVNECTDDGRSPMDIATAGGHVDMVQRLRLAGSTLCHDAAASTSSSTH